MKRLPLDAYRPEECIQQLPENTLVSIVMRLTGGTANPATVYEQIRRVKAGGPL